MGVGAYMRTHVRVYGSMRVRDNGATGMTELRDRLRQRFAKKTGAVAKARDKRKDYKGQRATLNLRVSQDLMAMLRLIRTAGGEDQNTFCERVLLAAAEARIGELRSGVDEGAWAVIIRCANGPDQKQMDR